MVGEYYWGQTSSKQGCPTYMLLFVLFGVRDFKTHMMMKMMVDLIHIGAYNYGYMLHTLIL